jgi:Tfp pilus tip-associated adhesin PilY1
MKMLNLRPHHRIKMPNSLAIFAVVLLLASAVAGFESNQGSISSGQQTIISTKSDNTGNNSVKHTTENKSHGLNLGLLLFRRG